MSGPTIPEMRGDGEAALIDAVRRSMRSERARVVLALHLSRLHPPAPRPHHQRIARSLLQEAVLRHGGQLYHMGNGDLVLLSGLSAIAAQAGAPGLPATLARLFGVDVPARDTLLSVWPVPEALAKVNAYVESCRAAPAQAAAPKPATGAGGFSQVTTRAAETSVARLATRQRGARISTGRQAGLALSHEVVSLSLAQLTASLPHAVATLEDPFLARHLASTLEPQFVLHLANSLEERPITGTGTPLPLHVTLSPASVCRPEFGRLVARFRHAGRLAVRLSMVDACLDPDRHAAACQVLRTLDIGLVLTGLTGLALPYLSDAALAADAIELAWEPRLSHAAGAEAVQLEAALARLDLGRVILSRVDAEKALGWGLARRITCFEGLYIDRLLNARSPIEAMPRLGAGGVPRGAGTLGRDSGSAAMAL